MIVDIHGLKPINSIRLETALKEYKGRVKLFVISHIASVSAPDIGQAGMVVADHLVTAVRRCQE